MNRKIFYSRKNRDKKGFTLAEMLMTVTIIVILFALAVPAIFAIQRNLRQKELDDKAKVIYTAVQDRLTELYTKGNTDAYNPSLHADEKLLSKSMQNMPADYTERKDDKIDLIYYFLKDSDIDKYIVQNDQVLSDDVSNGNWVIELVPYSPKKKNTDGSADDSDESKITAATVYAVYYSEDADALKDYADSNGKITDKFLGDYRDVANRKDKDQGDAKIGYYGGSTAGSGSSGSTLSVSSLVINSNKEINTAVAGIQLPYGIKEGQFTVKFTLEDTHGNSFVMSYNGGKYYLGEFTESNSEISKELNASIAKAQVGGSNYIFTLTLDNLQTNATRFINLYGIGNTKDSAGFKNNGEQLVSGSDITLTVDVQTQKNHQNKYDSKSAKGNSIFGYDEENALKLTGTNKAFLISCGRHLQNLDQSSGVEQEEEKSSISGAVLYSANADNKDTISLGVDSDFYESYGKNYFNGFETITAVNDDTEIKVPKFLSITNTRLSTLSKYNGNSTSTDDPTIDSLKNTFNIVGLTSEQGLFKVINNDAEKGQTLVIRNINLVGERVISNGVAGGFVGTVDRGSVTLFNSHVYLDANNGDIPTYITSDMNVEKYRWLQGATVGGLIGEVKVNGSVNITYSSVSTVLGNDGSVTGGMIGKNEGSSTFENCYADNYAYGLSVGGFVGENTGKLSITTSYSAGFIGLDVNESSKGAGFVNGTSATIDNSYTIIACYNKAQDNGINENDSSLSGAYFSVAENAEIKSKVYYLKNSVNANNNDKTLGIGNAKDIDVNGFIKTTDSDFSKVNVIQYHLLGKSVTKYEYPKLKISHYGDWSAEFASGSLVYYEVYKEGTSLSTAEIGFEGGNVASTLSNRDVIGDGYGIVYKTNSSDNPTKVTASKNNGSETDTFALTDDHYVIGEYSVYPLKTTFLLPENETANNFYTRLTLEEKTGGGTSERVVSTQYFDFNPYFARTVQGVAEKNSDESALPVNFSIRSPRHLYSLSLYYDHGYKQFIDQKPCVQEANLIYSTYQWSKFSRTTFENNKAIQQPIGQTINNAFEGVYNGGSYQIGDVGFIDAGFTNRAAYIGMFGYVGETGVIRNVVLATQYVPGKSYTVETSTSIKRNMSAYAGVLIGFNKGTVENCSVAGYYVAQSDAEDDTIYGYENSNIYLGGFVGWNEGNITNCSTSNPKISINMFKANCYTGGFAGYNAGDGTINNSYALTHITSDASDGKTVIAGFAGYNSASIRNVYCATSLTAQGTGTTSYPFVSEEGNGVQRFAYYLTDGSYHFVDGVYSYGNGGIAGSDTGALKVVSGVEGKTYNELVNLSNEKASEENSKFHDITTSIDSEAKKYPFKATVKDVRQQGSPYVHYGEWVVEPELGTYGVFYWEHEVSGENNGYKISYVGLIENTVYSQSTLCEAHDDGGIISEYGYGYYISSGKENTITLTANGTKNNDRSNPAQLNSTVQEELAKQISGITFYPFTTWIDGNTSTENFLCLSDDNEKQNATWTLNVAGTEYTYEISPFFADSISLKNNNYAISEDVNEKYISNNGSNKLGFSDNAYQIRSAQQLQFLNWNSQTHNTSTLATEGNATSGDGSYKKFNYLMSTSNTGKSQQTKNGAINKENADLVFLQTHDLNANDIENFTPIAGQNVSSGNNNYNAYLLTWFGGTFDGQSYKIQELNINSKSFTVGLFGTVVSANLRNIILYSSNQIKPATIQRETTNTDSAGAYAIGGLVGVAYGYLGSDRKPISDDKIINCSIAGYQIIDNSKNQETLGEVNIGGLVGICNMSLQNCSAVTNIEINCVHEKDGKFTRGRWGNHIRVGGLTGALQFKAENCYTGGSVSVSEATLKESYDSDNPKYNEQISTGWDENHNSTVEGKSGHITKDYSTNIYIAGIAGSGFTMNYRNFTGVEDNDKCPEGSPTVKNSYTYMTFPSMEGTIRSICMITSLADRYNQAYATDKDGMTTITNCYYLNSSAEFSTEYLPKYALDKSGTSVAEWATRNLKLINASWGNLSPNIAIEDMKLGRDEWLQNISGQTGNTVRSVSYDLNKVTYENLTSSSMITNLNKGGGTWSRVTSTDNRGENVNGKYSFNTGKVELSGKNYPFPTIITQSNGSKDPIHVHYGSWPVNGPHWQSGSETIDLIDDLDESSMIAEKTFVIQNADDKLKDAFDKGTLVLEEKKDNPDDPSYIEEIGYTDITKNEDGTYSVKIKAKDVGAAIIAAKWPSGEVDSEGNPVMSEADFTLTIQCNFTVFSNPRQFVLGNDENTNTGVALLSATSSSGKEMNTMADNFEWSAVSTRDMNPLYDDVNVSLGAGQDKSKLTLTGQGLNGSVTVTGTYIYGEHRYSSSVRITVNKQDFVGISNNTNYWEVPVSSTDLVGQEQFQAYYSADMAPQLDSSSYYLYELASTSYISDAITNGTVNLKLMDENGEVPNATVTLENGSSNGDYKYYPIQIDTSNVDMSTYGLPAITFVSVDLNRNNSVLYHLTMNVDVTFPYQLGFKDILPGRTEESVVANNISVTEDNKSAVSITPLEGIDFNTLREGYRIEGWYANRDVMNEDGSVTQEKVKILEADGTVVSKNIEGFVQDGALTLNDHYIVLHPVWFKAYTATPVGETNITALEDDELYVFVKEETKGTFQVQTIYPNKDDLRSNQIVLKDFSSNEDGSLQFTGFASGTNTINDLDCIWKGSEIKVLNETDLPTDRTLYKITIRDEDKFYAYDPQPTENMEPQSIEDGAEQQPVVEEDVVSPESQDGSEISSESSEVSE